MGLAMFAKLNEKAWPEIARFETDAGRMAANQAIGGVAMRSPRAWLLAILIAGILWLPFLLLARALKSDGSKWAPIVSIVIPAILTPTVISVARPFILSRNLVRRKLREVLRALGVPMCIPCGSELRGQSGDVCPECGQPHGLTRAM